MAKEIKSTKGRTVPSEAIRAAVKAGRAATGGGDNDRQALTAAVLAAVDNMAQLKSGYRVGEEDPNQDGDRDCDEYFYDLHGRSKWVCTMDEEHDGPHVAGDGYTIVAVWETK